MTLLGYNKTNYLTYSTKNYDKLNETNFRNIASLTGTTNNYVIVEKPKTLNFTLVYENQFFNIYKI